MAKIQSIQKQVKVNQWTSTQQRFLSIIQEEGKIPSAVEITKKAGFKSDSTWYQAIQDETFCEYLYALGWTGSRERTKGAVALTDNPDEEWSKDRVDLRRLVKDYPAHYNASYMKLDFSSISNPQLKGLIKRYFRVHLGFWRPSTIANYMHQLKPFFVELSRMYPEAESFAYFTRAKFEPLIHMPYWVNEAGQKHSISEHSKRYTLIILSGMFQYMQRHTWEGAPSCLLIFDDDMPKRSKKKPRPIPVTVVEQLQVHLHELPAYAYNLITILLVTGMRAEDALHLTEDCLEYDAAGDPRLRWYNHKMRRDGRPLPITLEVVEAVKRQQELVKNVPDLLGKQYLFRTEWGLYKSFVFYQDLNKLAQQIPILDLTGKVYHFTPHQFRHTVGTQMINGGMGIADVMAYLDHESAEMSLVYAEITDETLKQRFKQLVLSGKAAGGVALKVLREQLEKGDDSELDWVVSNLRRLSLPWGYCLHHAKAQKCPYGQNVCFTKDNGPCHKLVTTPEHAPVITATMEDLKKSKQIADEKGWEMYANDLRDQITGMEQVLAELQLPTDQRPKNRGGGK